MDHIIIMAGRLGRDVELKYLGDGTPVATFSMAVDQGWGDKKTTIWVRVTAWRKTAEVAAQYLKKGSAVLVKGELAPDKETGGPRIWQGRDGVAKASYEITANSLTFLPSGGDSGGQQAQSKPQASEESYDDELMF
jgi:single-strand DNA-binding protein